MYTNIYFGAYNTRFFIVAIHTGFEPRLLQNRLFVDRRRLTIDHRFTQLYSALNKLPIVITNNA